jgi:hypothetical protein
MVADRPKNHAAALRQNSPMRGIGVSTVKCAVVSYYDLLNNCQANVDER